MRRDEVVGGLGGFQQYCKLELEAGFSSSRKSQNQFGGGGRLERSVRPQNYRVAGVEIRRSCPSSVCLYV